LTNHGIKLGRLLFVHLQTYVSLPALSFHSVYPAVLPLPSPSPTLLIVVHVSMEIIWPRRAARISKNKGVFSVLVGKHKGKRRLVGAKIDGKRRRIAGCGLDSSC
jgi:hypothetical protein